MSDDSFFREVDEELRSERLHNFWNAWGRIIVAAAIVLILALAAWRYWEYSTAKEAAQAGDAFMEAVRLSQDGKTDESVTALRALQEQDEGGYATLARLRAAAELAGKGSKEEAVAAYDSVIASPEADQNMKALARVRAGMLLVDSGKVADVESRVAPLTAPGNPWRASAREALGLAHYAAGDLSKAHDEFNTLAEDSGTPQSMRQRVRIMLDIIAANGGPSGDG